MLGAAFLLVLIIDYFVSDRKKKIVSVVVVPCARVTSNLDNTKEFQIHGQSRNAFCSNSSGARRKQNR